MAARMAGVPFEVRTDTLTDEQLKAAEHWAKHPRNYLYGIDPLTKKQLVWTKDERDANNPLKPFPRNMRYLDILIDVLFYENGLILIDKARQMFCSTTVLLFLDWLCRFRPARRVLWSKTTEDEAKEMLRDKVRYPGQNLPEWVKAAFPQKDKPEIRVEYPKQGSYILAVAENVAEREARGGTASVVGVDEAARQRMFRSIIAAAKPMCDKIIALTTAEIGNDGADCFREYLEDRSVNNVGAVQLNQIPV